MGVYYGTNTKRWKSGCASLEFQFKKIFGETKFTVISQQFQNERAIYIGLRNHMDLIGFNAHDVPKSYGAKTMLREKFARINLFIDILINKQPKYLGNTIVIEKNESIKTL